MTHDVVVLLDPGRSVAEEGATEEGEEELGEFEMDGSNGCVLTNLFGCFARPPLKTRSELVEGRRSSSAKVTTHCCIQVV